MNLTDIFWRGVGVPFLTSGILLLLVARPWKPRREPDIRGISAAAPFLIAAAYMTAHLALSNWTWPGFVPADSTHWALLFALPAAGLSVADILANPGKGRRVLAAGLFLAAALGATAIPLARGGLSPALAMTLCGVLAGGLLWWTAMDASAGRLSPFCFLLNLMIQLSGASIVLLISGTGRVAQMVGALAAAAGPLFVPAILSPRTAHLRGALPTVATLLTLLWANGLLYTYAELGGVSLLLILAAALTGLLAHLPFLERWRSSEQRSLRSRALAACIAAGLLPLGAAILIAWQDSAPMEY